eukprot:CAMPEP_0115139916 /NCGR_PEP_ID=MMETSP0227-20121206/58595_1 /TAXON_ID=89957 /ORGANISM="Polarella glacialis, Strain CCMP 1383" /LENGTH=37 /DNA_ID= /DNA_START= /DNA_END= /DNA_ORIENTATION=
MAGAMAPGALGGCFGRAAPMPGMPGRIPLQVRRGAAS